jgi:hypothetical protein
VKDPLGEREIQREREREREKQKEIKKRKVMPSMFHKL